MTNYNVLDVLSNGRQEAETVVQAERAVIAQDASRLSARDRLAYFKRVACSVGSLAQLLAGQSDENGYLASPGLGTYRIEVEQARGIGKSGTTSARWGGLASMHTHVTLERTTGGSETTTANSWADRLVSVRTAPQLSAFGYSQNEAPDMRSRPGDEKLTRELVDIIEAERFLAALALEVVGVDAILQSVERD